MVMSEALVNHFFNRNEDLMHPMLVENQHHLDFKFNEKDISKLKSSLSEIY